MQTLAYRFLLPVIWLNSVFGNQTWYPSIVWLGQLFFWASLVFAFFIVIRAYGTRLWPLLLLGLVLATRLAVAIRIPGAQIAYSGATFFLFSAAGVVLAIHAAEILARQVRLFFIISVPVLFLQVAGVAEWLHVFNTLYAFPGLNEGEIIRPSIRMIPALFTTLSDLESTRMSDFEEFFGWQVRPPGLTHSSAMLGIYILGGLAIHFGRMKDRRVTLDDWSAACVVVLCGSKLALLGFILLLCFAYAGSGPDLRQRLSRNVMVLILVLFAYALIFPAAIQQNLGTGAFEVSFFLRGIDALLSIAPDVVTRVPAILDTIDTYHKSFTDETSAAGGRFSGAVTLIYALPFVAAAAFLGWPWIVRGIRYCRSLSPQAAHTAGLMAVVLLVAPLATPIFASQLYPLCLGIAFMPIACGFSSRVRRHLARAEYKHEQARISLETSHSRMKLVRAKGA